MKNLFNRNWKANASQKKVISIINNLNVILFNHNFKLFNFTIFSMNFWASNGSNFHDFKNVSIIPSEIRFELLGLQFWLMFKDDMKEIRKGRFEERGKCWRTQFVGRCFWLREIRVSWSGLFFTQGEIISWQPHTIQRSWKWHNKRWNEKKFFISDSFKLFPPNHSFFDGCNGGITTRWHAVDDFGRTMRFTFKIFGKRFFI
ncbi:MAG: hypothetical protein Unbinned2072contig1001_20 [Prokaryotic dsDNA virus sp.]|nr:MAG: hypothetical protein Unbinned2072contig1001_20 [Prokaryotic dsDNA virus sp.]|tara:strand:+ start:51 stop:656 length:606 start_codon:yes stop_codon:yes gene_type:complete